MGWTSFIHGISLSIISSGLAGAHTFPDWTCPISRGGLKTLYNRVDFYCLAATSTNRTVMIESRNRSVAAWMVKAPFMQAHRPPSLREWLEQARFRMGQAGLLDNRVLVSPAVLACHVSRDGLKSFNSRVALFCPATTSPCNTVVIESRTISVSTWSGKASLMQALRSSSHQE